ncbi:hypothetical protein D3C72_1799120 [compost metagenome]
MALSIAPRRMRSPLASGWPIPKASQCAEKITASSACAPPGSLATTLRVTTCSRLTLKLTDNCASPKATGLNAGVIALRFSTSKSRPASRNSCSANPRCIQPRTGTCWASACSAVRSMSNSGEVPELFTVAQP